MKFQTNIELEGHFFDTLLLPKILDTVLETGSECSIKQIEIGKSREEESYIRLKIFSPSQEVLDNTVGSLKTFGAKQIDIVVKRIELKGHIIDSLTLPKIFDLVINNGGRCIVEKINIGIEKESFSYAKLKIVASEKEKMNDILEKVTKNGAVII